MANQAKTRHPTGGLRVWKTIVWILSCEWLLHLAKRANGGAVIFLCTVMMSIGLYAAVIAITQAIDPTRTLHFSLLEFRLALGSTIPWFGAIFAGIYASLLTRFASQWHYLANLFNQIMAIEARTASTATVETKAAIDKWKAGFLHDALELHLATKPLFVSAVRRWGLQEPVKKHFVDTTPDGQKRYDQLMAALEDYPDLPRLKPPVTGGATTQADPSSSDPAGRPPST